MKPTLRENYRYIAIEIISESQLTKDVLSSIIKNEFIKYIGLINYSKVMPKLVYFDQEKQKAIIRCLNEGVEDLKSTLALFHSYNGKKIHLKSVYTSGTIKKAKEKII